MSKWSSPCCSVSFCYLIVVLLSVAHGQQKNGEFKHELPDDVELVDPKSLGLTDADLTKFLGNVKVLGGGQVGDTKTQILSVGFDGDENINFNDFVIPGLTDGKNTSLPEKDKEIADMAFKKFKEFFSDPQAVKQFEDGNNANSPVQGRNKSPQKQRQHNIPAVPPQTPNQFHIPMIQKPYTTPRVPLTLPVTTHHPPHPPRNFNHRPPPQIGHPPPPSPQVNHPLPQRPPQIRFPPGQLHQNHNNAQQSFNAQIKSPPQHLEFGARIPASPNVQHRPQLPPLPPRQSPLPIQQPPPPQQQFYQPNPGQFQQQQQHHRLVIQHPPSNQNNIQTLPPVHHQPQPSPPQQQVPHIYVQPPAIQHFPQHQQPQQTPAPQPIFNSPPRPQQQQQQQQPLQNIIIQHPIPQNIQIQSQSQHQEPHVQIQRQQHTSQRPQEQGRIVRNQLLQLESNNNNNKNNVNNNYLNYHTPPQLRPPPPLSAQSPPLPSATNQVPVHAQAQQSLQTHQPPAVAATATSQVYIQHGAKTTMNNIKHTPFHPQFQPPTRFAKDFTPIPGQTTTTRPFFEVTPSMKLIPLSTNENAITDPARMLQLRLYQQRKAQALAQASNHQEQTALPQQTTTAIPPTTTPPIISITTSYPETHSHLSSSTNFQSSSQPQPFDPRLNHNYENHIHQNDIYNSKPIFPLQVQAQQQNQIPNMLHHNNYSPQTQQPGVFYTQEHQRPPREGQPPPGFQFHVSHELGQPPRFQMYPDPKNMLNSIRKKRGYRRLSDLFNRMFRWDNRQ